MTQNRQCVSVWPLVSGRAGSGGLDVTQSTRDGMTQAGFLDNKFERILIPLTGTLF